MTSTNDIFGSQNCPLFKIYIIQEFSDIESVILLKVHHALADGIGCIFAFMCM